MGINTPSDIAADLRIGLTEHNMIRIFVASADGHEIAMDFTPDEATDIAHELTTVAQMARTKNAHA